MRSNKIGLSPVRKVRHLFLLMVAYFTDYTVSMTRDEFPKTVIEVLFKRAGARCCNPDCLKETFGPARDTMKSISIGVAAHITAAAKGGPRYSPDLTATQRRSADNGIWLCQTCSRIVDVDVDEYPTQLLREWKRTGEERASLALRGKAASDPKYSDEFLIKFYLQCLDRPAFQDDFGVEVSIEAFDQAMEDTIVALNTGVQRDRRGRELQKALGKVFVRNGAWRQQLDDVVDMIRGVRGLFSSAIEQGRIRPGSEYDGKTFYELRDPSLANDLNLMRVDIVKSMNKLASQVGTAELKGPDGRRSHSGRYGRW